MKLKQAIATLTMAALPLLVVGAGAQPAEHHSAQQAQAKSQQMMGHQRMNKKMCPRGRRHHREAKQLAAQLDKSFAAMETENDLATIKKELAADRALLGRLQSALGHQDRMMARMQEHMNHCPLMQSRTGQGTSPAK